MCNCGKKKKIKKTVVKPSSTKLQKTSVIKLK